MKSLDTVYETLALDEAAPGVVVVTLTRSRSYSYRPTLAGRAVSGRALGLARGRGA